MSLTQLVNNEIFKEFLWDNMELPLDEPSSWNDSACATFGKAVNFSLNSDTLSGYMEDGEEKTTAPVSLSDQVTSEALQDAANEKTTDSSTSEDANTNDGITDESCNSQVSKGKKSVSFNGFLTKEIDIDFRELGFINWNGVPTLTKDEVLSAYQSICNDHNADIEPDIVSQLSAVQINNNFSTILNLLDIRITPDKLEIYEGLFQRLNFKKLYINVDLLENDAVVEIFHMLEYYNSTKELILYGNYVNDSGLWSSIAVAVSNSDNDLNKISIHELRITDGGLMSIFNSINENPHIKVLRLNGCKLNFTPTFSIATPLKNNRFLKELHLCNAELYYKETIILALFLRDNYSLKVLNLSNNKLGDRGFKVLVKALVEQSRDGVGISVLMVANNRLTKTISLSVETLLKNCPLLHSINVGCNSLTDEFIAEIKESLGACATLKVLGLQSTLLTNEGVTHLMEICTQNEVLQYLNLRGNRALQHEALETVVAHLPHTHLKHIELDDANRFCTDAQEYVQILNNIRKLLLIKSSNDNSLFDKYNFTPEMALSCDIDYVPRCLSWRTPRSRGRFEVVSVPEATFSSTTSASTAPTSSSNSAEVVTTKEMINWSPAYSSYSQKTNWAKMKLLDGDSVGKKLDENGILEKRVESESTNYVELKEEVVATRETKEVSLNNNNSREPIIADESFKKDSDYDLLSVNVTETLEKQFAGNENNDEIQSTSPTNEFWAHVSTKATEAKDLFYKNDKVNSVCDEENVETRSSDAVESGDIQYN